MKFYRLDKPETEAAHQTVKLQNRNEKNDEKLTTFKSIKQQGCKKKEKCSNLAIPYLKHAECPQELCPSE